MLRRKERRRQAAHERAFPDAWREMLRRSVPLYRRLLSEYREELHGHIQVLLDEKHFEGAGGFELTEPMVLVIVAQAGLLLLHRPTDYYPKLSSILVYPGEYTVQHEVVNDAGFIEEVDELRVGESWQLGTLVLSWDEVERDLLGGRRNVVLHEFAHQIDAENGEMNGAPILVDPDLKRRWADVMTDAYERLVDATERRQRTLIDPYGATNPAEFFAVATETFFLAPVELARAEPDLYSVLRDFYRLDPARW